AAFRPGNHAATARAEVVGQFQSGAAVQYRQRPSGLLDGATDQHRRSLAFQDAEIGVVAAQAFDRFQPQADADVFGRVLDSRRYAGGINHAPEEAQQRRLVDAGSARWLQHDAGGTGALGLAHEFDLFLDGLAEHGNRER